MKTIYEALLNEMAIKGHSVEEVEFVSSLDGKFQCNFKLFAVMAWMPNTARNDAPLTATDLVVVMADGGSYRRTVGYDGETWLYVPPVPVYNRSSIQLERVHGKPWGTCEDLNGANNYQASPYPGFEEEVETFAAHMGWTHARAYAWVEALEVAGHDPAVVLGYPAAYLSGEEKALAETLGD